MQRLNNIYLPVVKLRSLQIKGFKSFANETTINFNDEIIGVVGPNGSGKSNIVDAIRWVLGEQKSKELRLEKMVDVIFNGTKSKRKAGMAQVSMTFENSAKLIPLPYDNIKVSRILYDNNDSEYRINDVPCRLKDVRNLFLDTGIGSNSYAIIELGMVDDILTNKDNARRKMFEQAAGIAKYKVRKRETLLKLKSTQSDLDRVADILFELEGNLKTLERQAKRTKKYYELKDEYKDLSIKKAVVNQKDAIEKEQHLKKVLLEKTEKHVVITSDLHNLETVLESTKKANLESEEKLSTHQKEYNAIIEKIRSHESKKDILIQNQSFQQQNSERATKNKNDFSSTLAEINEEYNLKKREYELLQAVQGGLEEDFQTWKSKYDEIENQRQNVQGENSSELEELSAIEDQRFLFEKEIIELDSIGSNINRNKESALNEIKAYDLQHSKISETLDLVLKDLKENNTKLTDLKNQQTEKLNEKNRLSQSLNLAKEELNKINRHQDAMSNEYKLLNDMVNNLEGFPESSKFLVKNWADQKPILSDIIECEEEYRSTVESYLEQYLTYFVLADVQEARASIELLHQAQKGKSKFFILSSFDNNQAREQLLYDHLGKPALSVIKTETKYFSLINHLLKNVVIVEDSKILNSDFPNEDVIYISKSGTSNRTRHTITGGSIGLFDGKRIGRKTELSKLKEKIERGILEYEDKQKEIEKITHLLTKVEEDNVKQELLDTDEIRNKLNIEVAQLKTQVGSINVNKTALQDRISEYLNTFEKSKVTRLEINEKLNTVLAQIQLKKATINDKSGRIEEIAKNLGEISSRYSEAQINWAKHQNDIKNIENDLAFRSKQKVSLHSKLEQSDKEISDTQQTILNNKKTLKEIEESLVSEYSVRDVKQTELTETEQFFSSKRSVVTEKESELKKLNKKQQDSQLDINNAKDKLTGIEFELRSGMERLKIEFNIDLKTISQEAILESIEDFEELVNRYNKVKKRLDSYGEINPMAMEAYDEIMERYNSMTSQRDDIITARDSLYETITEIDGDAKDKFLVAFNKAKENFKDVFRSLFSEEDDCDLVLFNPENPLESEIEIVAKPKGKRPKVLNQLSGGEKTLTATALLFSLYLLKPAPFCIFDEVDAPLDDLNIQKFSKLIRKFADASQFIVITHNKSTMAAMDLLYGVYMQEQGISGVTKVDFREYEHNEVFQTVNM